ncbi:hypothetical protein QUB19_26535, partial [Microcoleus sp. B4-C5]|uniref:hypothetical protein n=1 Tax=unclassified Microcoleus TaxID=2642155 RepID=UPI002FD1116F
MESVSLEDFGTIEQKILQLVISYCCYFIKGFPTPSAEYRYSSKEAYYSLAIKMANEGGISKKNATQISWEHPDFASIQKYDMMYCFFGKPTLSF